VSSISPTAPYTGYVWARNGLSHPELASLEGRLMFEATRPTMTALRLLGGTTLESYLLARHVALDDLLTEAIERHGATQVIEVACGLSPRGWRFVERYDRLVYIEADLPDMAARKRDALARMGSLSSRHRVEDLDALRDEGPGSLAAISATLDQDEPLVIITEGLLSYFDQEPMLGMWRRFADTLSGFADGRYFSDIHLSGDARGPHVFAARAVLSAFVRGPVELHFADVDETVAALLDSGFATAAVHQTEANLTRVIEASA
jgi:O-methyltransferase involved in polyketide biosynthesis